jgi:hypothetical protein
MKAWVISNVDYDSSTPVAVFSSKERAESFKLTNEHYEIEEVDVDPEFEAPKKTVYLECTVIDFDNLTIETKEGYPDRVGTWRVGTTFYSTEGIEQLKHAISELRKYAVLRSVITKAGPYRW